MSQTSTVSAIVGVGAGDPDLASAAPGTGPPCGSTAVVAPGQWVAGPASCGSFARPGAADTATGSMSIQAKAFDPAVSAPLGDVDLTAISPPGRSPASR